MRIQSCRFSGKSALSRLAALLLLGTLLAGTIAATAGLELQPYVQAVTGASATITWKPVGGGTGEVAYGTTTAYGASAVGAVVYPLRGGRPRPSLGSAVRAHLTGLSPDTLYHYRVDLPGSAGEDRTFRTAPVGDDGTFTFVVYGDSRSNPEAHGRVATAAASVDPAFVLATGDAVPSTAARQAAWVGQFFDPAEPLLRKAPLFVTPGNHEARNPLLALYFEAPGQAPARDCYSFDWGPVHVVTINTNKSFRPGTAQYRFLAADLAATTKPFRVFFAHHPAYSSGRHGSNGAVQKYLKPLFEANGVQLVFSGHDHSYERAVVNGITYVVTGGGGAPLYGAEHPRRNPTSVVFRSAFHFVRIDASPARLSLSAWAVEDAGGTSEMDRAIIVP